MIINDNSRMLKINPDTGEILYELIKPSYQLKPIKFKLDNHLDFTEYVNSFDKRKLKSYTTVIYLRKVTDKMILNNNCGIYVDEKIIPKLIKICELIKINNYTITTNKSIADHLNISTNVLNRYIDSLNGLVLLDYKKMKHNSVKLIVHPYLYWKGYTQPSFSNDVIPFYLLRNKFDINKEFNIE